MSRQLPKDVKPDAFVLSVGGGGLLMGVYRGLERVGWASNTNIVCVETWGAESLNACVTSGAHAKLPAIQSVAKTLGAVQVCRAAFELATAAGSPVRSVVVTDAEAVEAIGLFRSVPGGCLVEPACSAALAAVVKADCLPPEAKVLVVIVCGGNAISEDLLVWYRANAFAKAK